MTERFFSDRKILTYLLNRCFDRIFLHPINVAKANPVQLPYPIIDHWN